MARSLRAKIAEFINRAAVKGFVWGENDCALFANNMCVEIFGAEDYGAKFRGKYTDYKTALQVTKELGYEDIAAIPAKHLLRVNKGEIGDVVAYFDNRTLGVCLGGYSYFLGHEGLIKVETRKLERFYRCQKQFQS